MLCIYFVAEQIIIHSHIFFISFTLNFNSKFCIKALDLYDSENTLYIQWLIIACGMNVHLNVQDVERGLH